MRVPRASTSSLAYPVKPPSMSPSGDNISKLPEFHLQPSQHLGFTVFNRTPPLPGTWGTVAHRTRSDSFAKRRKESPNTSQLISNYISEDDDTMSLPSPVVEPPRASSRNQQDYACSSEDIFLSVRNGFEGQLFASSPSNTLLSGLSPSSSPPKLPSISNFFAGCSTSSTVESPRHASPSRVQSVLNRYSAAGVPKSDIAFSGPPSTLAQKIKPFSTPILSDNIIISKRPRLTISARLKASIKPPDSSPGSSTLSDPDMPSPLSLPDSGINCGSPPPMFLSSAAVACIPPALQIPPAAQQSETRPATSGALRLKLRIKRPELSAGDASHGGNIEISYEKVDTPEKPITTPPEEKKTIAAITQKAKQCVVMGSSRWPARKTRSKLPSKFSNSPPSSNGFSTASASCPPEPKAKVLDVMSSSSMLATANLSKINFRDKFEQLPAAVQHEIMRALPLSMTSTDDLGGLSLKAGVLSPSDTKFKQDLLEWQGHLLRGEFDTEVRRKYVELALAEVDPWKLDNFEPVYGDIMNRRRSPRRKDTQSAENGQSSSSSALFLS